jgi:hypothetical protein
MKMAAAGSDECNGASERNTMANVSAMYSMASSVMAIIYSINNVAIFWQQVIQWRCNGWRNG